ncbi:uncharacterized protein EAF01_001952 [Botrytis porri]|uniref:uncharacterized protein n=1 Tax=Botrytis porri TaxID=87229 RepID=UPI0019020E4B|nr:uncharacterized protein EAF01_001952 [Botrytis porri]KAF7912931.1 hypothetical protein EAF01_001952 [Botrytis porri]
MERSLSTSEWQPSSLFTNSNGRHSSEAGPSRTDISTTTNEKSTGLENPRPWNYYSDLGSHNSYDDDRLTFRSKNKIVVSSPQTSGPQQSTARKRKASSGIEPASKIIIHESCIAAGVSSPKLQSVKAKVKLLEMQYPDDLPYIITFSHNTQTLYLECQECSKSLSLLKGGGNVGSHASSVLHSTCVDERLRKLEVEGFRRQVTEEVRTRETAMYASPAVTSTRRSQRLWRRTHTSKQQCTKPTPSENFESTPSSENKRMQSKRRLIVAPFPTHSPAEIPHSGVEMSDEMLTRYQGFDKTLEDAVVDINVRQSTQHRLLIDEVQKKISCGLVPFDNLLTTLEKCVQKSYQSVQHKELTEQRISKAWHSSESALRVVKKLEGDIKASEEKFSAGLNLARELAEVVDRIEKGISTSSEIDRVGRLENEVIGVKEVLTGIRRQNDLDKVKYPDKGPLNVKVSQSQPDTDPVTALNEKVNKLTAKVSNLAGLVETHGLPTSHGGTANNAALIEDLKKSKGTMMKRLATSEERLAALEEQNDKLISKIKELEKM